MSGQENPLFVKSSLCRDNLLNLTLEKYDICILIDVVNGLDIGKMYETASR